MMTVFSEELWKSVGWKAGAYRSFPKTIRKETVCSLKVKSEVK